VVGSVIVLVALALGLMGIDPASTQQQRFTDEVEAVTGQPVLVAVARRLRTATPGRTRRRSKRSTAP
jgi:hypothetical protein